MDQTQPECFIKTIQQNERNNKEGQKEILRETSRRQQPVRCVQNSKKS